MKMTRHLLLSACAAASALAVVGVGATAFKSEFIPAKNAASAVTTRRVWLVDQDPGWWGTITLPGKPDNKKYADITVHAWSTEADAVDPKMTLSHDDYWGGLFYVDIPIQATKVIFRKTMPDGGWGGKGEKTNDLVLPKFGGADVFYLKSGLNTLGNRNCDGGGTAGMGYGQVQHLLSLYDTCSPNGAYGYNAYPQLMANFIAPSTLDTSLQIFSGSGDKGYNGKLPTIAEKLEAMRLRYEAEHPVK